MSIENKFNNFLDTSNLSGELKYMDIDIDSENNKNKINNTDRLNMLKLMKAFSIKFNNLNINDFKTTLSILFIHTVLSIVFMFLYKKYALLIGLIFSIYITLVVISNTCKLDNNRYINLSILNMSNSLNMFIKNSFEVNKLKINYNKINDLINIVFLISLGLSSIYNLECILLISTLLLIFSYILCFSVQDILKIKESLNLICNYSIFPLILGNLIFSIITSYPTINSAGYITLLILNYFKIYIENIGIINFEY